MSSVCSLHNLYGGRLALKTEELPAHADWYDQVLPEALGRKLASFLAV